MTAFLTNSPRFNVAFLDARRRARGRFENRIKTLKSTELGKLPYWSFAANQAWADLAMFAVNLVSWLQLAVLPGGHEAGCWDLKRWRYRLFSMAGKAVSGGRQRRLLIPVRAPEAQLLVQLQHRILACCSSGGGTDCWLPELVVAVPCFLGFERRVWSGCVEPGIRRRWFRRLFGAGKSGNGHRESIGTGFRWPSDDS